MKKTCPKSRAVGTRPKTNTICGIDWELFPFLLLAVIGIAVGVHGCLFRKNEAKARNKRSDEFRSKVERVSSGLTELEQSVANISAWSESNRQELVHFVQQIRTNYVSLLKAFDSIRKDEQAAGRDQIQKLWMLDNMDKVQQNQGRYGW